MAKTTKNPNGVTVAKCCASCLHKLIRKDGTRRCNKLKLKVAQMHLCGWWEMSYLLRKLRING